MAQKFAKHVDNPFSRYDSAIKELREGDFYKNLHTDDFNNTRIMSLVLEATEAAVKAQAIDASPANLLDAHKRLRTAYLSGMVALRQRLEHGGTAPFLPMLMQGYVEHTQHVVRLQSKERG
jgi:hypothetical protein